MPSHLKNLKLLLQWSLFANLWPKLNIKISKVQKQLKLCHKSIFSQLLMQYIIDCKYTYIHKSCSCKQLKLKDYSKDFSQLCCWCYNWTEHTDNHFTFWSVNRKLHNIRVWLFLWLFIFISLNEKYCYKLKASSIVYCSVPVDIVNYINAFIWTYCELFIHLRHNMMFAFTSWNNYLLICYFVFVCRIYGWSFMQRNTQITEILKNCITHVYSHFCRFNRLIIIKNIIVTSVVLL